MHMCMSYDLFMCLTNIYNHECKTKQSVVCYIDVHNSACINSTM